MQFKPKALLFDLNGTMIDDMDYHAKAWQSILNEDLGANLSYDEVKKQMYGKNSELLHRIFGKGYFTEERELELSFEKERRYQSAYGPSLALINGLNELLAKAKNKAIPMAIGSAAIPFNINFVLNGLQLNDYFKAIVSADDVEISKPNPETFLKAADLLAVPAADCLVFEDAPKGVEAAANAGMPCIVLTTMHNADEFSAYQNIIAFISDYTDPVIQQLF